MTRLALLLLALGAIRDSARALGLDIRAGVHTGEWRLFTVHTRPG